MSPDPPGSAEGHSAEEGIDAEREKGASSRTGSPELLCTVLANTEKHHVRDRREENLVASLELRIFVFS